MLEAGAKETKPVAPFVGSVPSVATKPKESRRWLKRQVPKEQLYRLAPLPKRIRLGELTPWDRVRIVVRAWWAWFAVALLLEFIGLRITGILAGAISFALYHTSPDFHPAVYALEPDFDSASAEFRETMVGGNRHAAGGWQSRPDPQQRR